MWLSVRRNTNTKDRPETCKKQKHNGSDHYLLRDRSSLNEAGKENKRPGCKITTANVNSHVLDPYLESKNGFFANTLPLHRNFSPLVTCILEKWLKCVFLFLILFIKDHIAASSFQQIKEIKTTGELKKLNEYFASRMDEMKDETET